MAARDEIGLDDIRRRAAVAQAVYEGACWTGSVERAKVTLRPSIALKRCSNEFCREWPIEGSRAAGVCLTCGTPLTT